MTRPAVRRALLVLAGCVAVAAGPAACGGDDGGSGDGSGDGGADDGGDGDDDGGGDGGDGGGTGDGDGSGTDDVPPGPNVGTPAAGIQLHTILANQGVGVPLVSDGTVVAAAQRNAPLIAGRPMLVRALWDVDAGFTPREIEARLVFENADGTTTVLPQTKMVSGPSSEASITGGFSWLVEPEDVQAGAGFHVGAFEVGGGGGGDASGARLPATGEADLGAWGDRMVLDVMLVPISGCGETPNLDATALEQIHAFVFNTYPVQELNLEVHAPVDGGCDEWYVTFDLLPQVRMQDGAPPHVYYVGIIGSDGGGVSQPTEGSEDMAYPRTCAYHDWRDYGPSFDLLAHELGHNHGREHTFEDPSYPYEAYGVCGGRATTGFGVLPGEMPSSLWSNDIEIGVPWVEMQDLIPPTTNQQCDYGVDVWSDFMSYAYPFWISDHTYGALADRIRLISSWSMGRAEPGAGHTLRGLVRPDGSVSWTSMPGVAAPRSEPTGTARLRTAGGDAVDLDVFEQRPVHDPPPGEPHRDTGHRLLVIPVADGHAAERLELDLDGVRRTFDLAER